MNHTELDSTYDLTWSKLINTEMGVHVYELMNDPRRHYHNFLHVQRLYRHAQRLNVPYSAELDLAILWHDAVYDENPDKELRSVDALKQAVSNNPKWVEGISVSDSYVMIVNTIEHIYTDGVNPWMIRLDVEELGYPDMAYENFWALLDESCALYGIDASVAAGKTIDFMRNHMLPTIKLNEARDIEYDDRWSAIGYGCDDVILMARVTKELYERGTVQ